VRQPVLRPGKPIETCIFEGDGLSTTTHLGLYVNNELAGIVSIFDTASKLFFLQGKQFQLRGMAVLPQYQKQGLGEKLVESAEKLIVEKEGNLIWFNARENAVGFYKKLGYEVKGDVFDIAGVGPHYIMYKALT
jgi:ribosomal protein S18 acetylase RimI-like enzyme